MKQFAEVSKWIGVKCFNSDDHPNTWRLQFGTKEAWAHKTTCDVQNAEPTILMLEAIEAKGYVVEIYKCPKGSDLVTPISVSVYKSINHAIEFWKDLGDDGITPLVVVNDTDSLFKSVLSAATAVAKEIQKNA